MLNSAGGDFFFFNDTATTEIYTLSLHDALPISRSLARRGRTQRSFSRSTPASDAPCGSRDRKSTRLHSSHEGISYDVFCLKKKIHPTLATYPHIARKAPKTGAAPTRTT